MTAQFEEIIALLIINLGDKFANSYALCKILSRYFDIVNCRDIIVRISNANYIEAKSIEGFDYFKITLMGYNIIEENKLDIKKKLKENFPERVEFIEHF